MSHSDYQWQVMARKTSAESDFAEFMPQFGIGVVSRFKTGVAKQLRIRVYTQDLVDNLYLICDSNKWGKKDSDKFLFQDEGNGFASLDIDARLLPHKSAYLLLWGRKYMRDPAAKYFDDEGNCVWWDHEDPSAYKPKNLNLDKVNRSVKILQTDLPGLIVHYRDKKGRLGHEVSSSQWYQFISESGVVEKIAELGFNAIQFLPVSQSIDGGKWSFRYLVPFLHSINKNWGTPDDFAKMIDVFHKNGIAVILDQVISHVPHKRYSLFDKQSTYVGIHRWTGEAQDEIFLGEETSWGTKRYQYHNPIVRRFIVESALTMMQRYHVDGFRIDNVDGILRHGKNGDGPDRHGGRELLREFSEEIYKYDPHSYVHLESHYFHGNNAKLLAMPLEESKKALGATAYTSSRLTYFFHRNYMPKGSDSISPWNVKDIVEEKEWGKSNSTIADFHNHDAAAGLMSMRATGSYAYDALILNNPELHVHAVGKIKVMEAIISLGMEGRTLDLAQTFLLQTGTFEHDSTIMWFLEQIGVNKAVLGYKTKINLLMDEEAFWPKHTDKRVYANVDEKSKTLVIHRSDGSQQYVVLINMVAHMLFDFIIPLPKMGKYEMLLNSDLLKYAGSGRGHYEDEISSQLVDQFEFFENGLELGTVPPYAVLVWRKKI